MNQKWIKLMNKPTLDANDYTWINLDTIRKVKVEKGDIVTSEKTVKDVYLITVVNTNGVYKYFYGDIYTIHNFENVMMSGVK